MRDNLILEKSYAFSLKAVDLYKQLLRSNEYVLSKQFLRSATSVGANVEEALAGYNKRDFAFKMSISTKEARETLYWLRLLEYGNFVEYNYESMRSECQRLIRILTSIVKTTQEDIRAKTQ